MFLPGVSLKVKLVGIAVLAILTFSLVGTALAAVNQVVAEGTQQSQITQQSQLSQLQFANVPDSQGQATDDHAVVSGLKFVCPFH